MDTRNSTLVGTEQRFSPMVRGIHYGCLLVGLARCIARPVRTLMWLPLSVSNIVYLRQHERPSVGMVPLSVASLGLAPAAATALFFGAGIARLRSVYSKRTVPQDHARIIVLGGAVKGGKPGRTLTNRLDVAAALWRHDPSITLLLTGGTTQGEDKSEAECMAEWLVKRGVRKQNLLLETHARNTRENIANALELIQARDVCGQDDGQLYVLSNDYHLYRAVREGARLGVELTPLPAPTPWLSRPQQWCREVLTVLAKA